MEADAQDCGIGTNCSRSWVSLVLALLGIITLSGCANVSTTVFKYHDIDGSTVLVEMPKEIEAKELVVEINAKNGTATIAAKEWSSRNAETIDAQAKREEKNLGKIGGLVEKGSEGAARGAVKGVVP